MPNIPKAVCISSDDESNLFLIYRLACGMLVSLNSKGSQGIMTYTFDEKRHPKICEALKKLQDALLSEGASDISYL